MTLNLMKCLTKRQIVFNAQEELLMTQEIEKLLNKEVINEIDKSEVKYLSTIFLRPKRDDSYRLILNLRKLNDFVDKLHLDKCFDINNTRLLVRKY